MQEQKKMLNFISCDTALFKNLKFGKKLKFKIVAENVEIGFVLFEINLK